MNNALLYPMCKQHKHVHTCRTQWEIFQQSIWQLLTNLETKHGVENFYHCSKEVQKSFSTHTKLRTAVYNGHELILPHSETPTGQQVHSKKPIHTILLCEQNAQ